MLFGSDEDFIVALTVWRESRGQPLEGQIAVAATIYNRAEDPKKRWPRSPLLVCLQKLQFSCFNPGDPNAVKWPDFNSKSWSEALEAQRRGKEENRFGGVNHYHTKAVSPKWSVGKTPYVVIGDHQFFKF